MSKNDGWIRSSFSGSNGNCFEMALKDGEIAVRNSNRPEDGILTGTKAELLALIQGVKACEFDGLAE